MMEEECTGGTCRLSPGVVPCGHRGDPSVGSDCRTTAPRDQEPTGTSDEKIALGELRETISEPAFLRETIGFAAPLPMEPEVGEPTGAGYGERSPGLLLQRNSDR